MFETGALFHYPCGKRWIKLEAILLKRAQIHQLEINVLEVTYNFPRGISPTCLTLQGAL